ncbi:MAG: DUF294 nucleotidyltransferase-like domain-containing protein [Pseudomonadota bacterium]
MNAGPPALSVQEILNFLSATEPFADLPAPVLEGLASRCGQEFHPKGSSILTRAKSQVTHLRLIHHGQVRLFLRDDNGSESMVEIRGGGQAIGALGILRESLSNLDVVAEHDTLCVLVGRDDYLALTESQPRFAQFYLKHISEAYVGKALTELARPRVTPGGGEGALYLFTAQVGDLARRRPVTIAADAQVQQAAALMSEERAGCLLVTDPAGEIVGIVTDRDLRNKVVASGRDFRTPVADIMTAPVQAIPSHTTAFDALLEMMRRRVHHLALERQGKVVGIISGHDLMVLQGTSPLFLVREIMAQDKIEGLYDLSLKSPRVVRSLIYEGAKPGYVCRLITLINDHILDRLLTLLVQELGDPPVPFCWLLMGSEGRREQTFRTDQDNGLIYRDPTNAAEARAAQEYFAAFGAQAIEHLVRCGFARCKGGIMASNPQWCRPYSVWRGYFERWVSTPEPKDVLHATIFFDFRAGWGDLDLGERLRSHLMGIVSGQDVFLRFLARDTMTTPAALSTFFRNFITEREGPHKGRLDLKTRGLVPFVDFARLMSLKHGVRETNTLERLTRLDEKRGLSHELYLKISQSYELMMQLRLVHQQLLHEEGLEPDNFVDPQELSDLERSTLKEAFAVVAEIKAFLREVFQLGSA